MIHKYCYIFLFGLLSARLWAESNSFSDKPDLFDILEGKNRISITLSVPLDSLFQNRFSENHLSGIFYYKPAGGKKYTLNVSVQLRGKFRRKMCGFPPLKLNFYKSELNNAQLSKHDEYKLVTHCLEGEEGKYNILKEYLVYQLYQRISPLSYRTKLVSITYQDTKSDTRISGMAILLEDKSAFEKRVGLKEIKDSFNLPRTNFDDANFRTHSLFQYLIGNTDWSTTVLKNLDVFRDKNTNKMFVVPYDFDFSGFVNAAYAVPNKDYNQKKLRDRILLEADKHDLLYQEEIKKFMDLKPVLQLLIKEQKGLTPEMKVDLEHYFNSFYEDIKRGLTRRID